MQNGKSIPPKNLMKLIKRMNQVEKRVACLYYFENLSVIDIASILQADEKYVQKLLEEFIAKISLQISKTKSLSNQISR